MEPAVFDAGLTAADLRKQGSTLLDAGRIIDGTGGVECYGDLGRATDEGGGGADSRKCWRGLIQSVFLGTAVLPEDPLARFVNIRPGDTFLKLGQGHAVTAAYLEAINPSLNSHNLRPLTGVKIVQGPFSLRISKRYGRGDLFVREMYVRSFAVEMPEGNYLPRGEYRLSQGNKIQAGGADMRLVLRERNRRRRVWQNGWLYGSCRPRGKEMKDRATGMRVGDSDLQELYNLLVESRSHIRVEP